MSYIGRTPQIGAYHKLDSITCDGSTAYTMQLDSANFVPESVNHLIVSVNGVIQAPTDSFTVSSSTITFASALSSSDTIDFIMALGNVLDIGTPSDATVSLSKLTATGTKDATTFLRGDNTFAVPAGGENTPAFFAHLSSSQSVGDATTTKVQINTEVLDTDNCYDNSTNYRFTPTTAGKYFVFGCLNHHGTSANNLTYGGTYIYKNGGNYVGVRHNADTVDAAEAFNVYVSAIVDMNGSSDYLELYAQTNTNGGNGQLLYDNVAKSCYFGAYRIIGA
jgi:hypothetical protein